MTRTKGYRHDLEETVRGTTFDGLDIELKINGSGKDLSDTQIRIEFRYGKETGEVAKTLTIGNGITLLDAEAGKFRIEPFNTKDWKAGTYYYDIRFSDTRIKAYIYGTFPVPQNVTNG